MGDKRVIKNIMQRYLFLLVSIAAFLEPLCLFAQADTHFGPADKPERYFDYGGTEDLRISEELGLSLEELEALLSRLSSATAKDRFAAAKEISDNAAGSESTFRVALWKEEGARNSQIKEAVRAARRATGVKGEEKTDGLLNALIALDPTNGANGVGVRSATRIMVMLVALNSLNTMAGYKVLLDFSGTHAGGFRQEIGEMLVADGMKALPALIYGRGSPDEELHMFSVKWIRDMGSPLLGEQIKQIENPRRLAQLLEAYASVNDLGAVDVTLSLANHESMFVRRAARRCLEHYSVNAKWSIRRVYENTFSKEPDTGTDFDEWLKSLYEHWDEERTSNAIGMLEDGKAAYASDNLALMEELYRKILKEEPMFLRRHEMAAGFLALARHQEDSDKWAEALNATLMAYRLAEPNSKESRLARSHLIWLEAENLRKAGILDAELYKKAAELDPENDKAHYFATAYLPGGESISSLFSKVFKVSIVFFLGAILVYLRMRVARRSREFDKESG